MAGAHRKPTDTDARERIREARRCLKKTTAGKYLLPRNVTLRIRIYSVKVRTNITRVAELGVRVEYL